MPATGRAREDPKTVAPHRGDASFAQARAILTDLENRFGIKVDVRVGFRSAGFAPAAAFLGSVMREALTGASLAATEGLAPEQLLGAGFDAVKD